MSLPRILIAAKRFTTPPEVKEESTFEESCISEEEHLFELEIEREEEGISVIKIMKIIPQTNVALNNVFKKVLV